MTLRLDWISAKDARSACERWHYSATLPMSPGVYLGVWEDGRWIGAVIFSRGANLHIGSPFGLTCTQAVELTRVALRGHAAPVSRIVAVALKMLKRQSPEVEIVVSYADPVQDHAGTIYQAGGWIYLGKTPDGFEYRLHGVRLQKRAYTGSNYGGDRMALPKGATKVATPGKHKYVWSYDPARRATLQALALPYPKRASEAGDGPPRAQRRGSDDPDAPSSSHAP